MKRVILAGLFSISVVLSLSGSLYARTFVRDYSYRASEADSKITARSIALNQVKTQLLEEIGVYIESNFEDTAKESKAGIEQLTKQQIVSITAGVTETKILEEKWDGLTYYMKAEITVDIDDVSKKVKEIAKDRDKTRELEEVKKKADEAFKQIGLLQEKLSKTENEKEKLKLQADYQKRSDELTAADWSQMGYNALDAKEYDKAILYFQKAIGFPARGMFSDIFDSEAYSNLGFAYLQKGNYDKAIEQYEKAISISPKYNTQTYYNMGFAYYEKGNYDKAILYYQKVINSSTEFVKNVKLPPGFVLDTSLVELAYVNMGITYYNKGNYDKAIEQYGKAISIAPKNINAYYNMGLAYADKGNQNKAISCLKQAARLGCEPAQKDLTEKGIDW